jgi:hypothetical protein
MTRCKLSHDDLACYGNTSATAKGGDEMQPPELVSHAATPSHCTSSIGPPPAISMGVVLCRMEDVHRRSSHEKAGSEEDGVGVGGGHLIVAEAR